MAGRRLVLSCLLLATAVPAYADDSALCADATATAEHQTGVPDQLLGAISRVETGRYLPDTGAVRAWPWTINAQGVGHYYESKAEAVAAAHGFLDAGIRSIDVGCLQVNLMYHPDGFASLDQAFDPAANALYAARFLQDLFHQTGSWPHAAAAYHSQTPDLGIDYQRKVLDAWAEPTDGSPRTDGSHRTTPVRTVSASPNPAAAMSRPLGGFGRILRDGLRISGPPPSGSAPFGSLASYRARPVALAAFRPPPAAPAS